MEISNNNKNACLHQKILVKFLQHCGVVCNDYSSIHTMIIPREVLLCDEKYKGVIDYIPMFKKMFSSSYLTSLQTTALEKQRWPLLNIVRQILKEFHFRLNPKRLSNGYTKDKKKIYRRVFIIEKLNNISDIASGTIVDIASGMEVDICENIISIENLS